RPVLERRKRADRVYARDEAPEPLQRVEILELRRASGAARIKREAKSRVLGERLAGRAERRNHRNLALGELERKSVLFVYRSVRPALRPIELGDQRRAVFEPELIDAILEAVQRDQPAVAAISPGLHRIEDELRVERVVSGHADNLAYPAPTAADQPVGK